MEPDRQIEIQLGHMCNNRCVFCVSGQRTALGEAGPMPVAPILERIRQARALGHHKITLLGGEPTLQPGFLEIVREMVELGFEEIVLFTNGAKTSRGDFIDAIRATGGRFTWRISIQGATRESHERTTQKPGSFGRIVRTLENLAARGEPITVNMCVVTSNFEDVDRFPALLLAHGARQLHLDMMRPLDAGDRTEDELRATIPRYSDLAAPFRRMVAGFPEDFDVNVGNLPFCVAPDLTPWIHHDGEHTDTIAIDGDDRLSTPWNKYLVKRRDKLKPESCRRCVLHDRCSGVFETYARFHGVEELVPVDAASLKALDPRGRMVGLWAPPLLAAAGAASARARSDRQVALSVGGRAIELRPASDTDGAIARYGAVTVHRMLVGGSVPDPPPMRQSPMGTPSQSSRVADAPAEPSADPSILEVLGDVVHPLSSEPSSPRLAAALRKLRAAAPFGELRWTAATERDGRLELTLEDPSTDARAILWLEPAGGGGYRVDGEPTDALRAGLRQLFDVLRSHRGAARIAT